jgi:DNA-binding FadR family transcriptional regulator
MPASEVDPIPRRKLSDEVQDRLWQMIESGRFAPGEALPSERDLMKAFGVGRPAVREALQSLGKLGLVAISHGERARVVAPTPDAMFGQLGRTVRHLLASSPETLEQLKQARLMFESAMVALAAARANDEDIQNLRAILERQKEARRDGAAFLAADMRFHEAIAALSGNAIFRSFSAALLSWLVQFRQELVRSPGAEKITLAEHEEILEAIAIHDEVRARLAMAGHLNRANRLYRARKKAANAKS